MEDLFVGVLLALGGSLAFLGGRMFSPKNKTLAQQSKWFEEELAHMRTEVNRYRSKANYYAKGAVPSELATMAPTAIAPLIDGIIDALPPNFRRLAQSWKKPLIDYMSANPEMVNDILGKVKGMVGGNKDNVAEMQLL